MDANAIAQQITARINNAISGLLTRPIATLVQFAVWATGTVVLLMTASVVLSPLAPAYIRPHGDVTKLIYVAGILYLMRGR